MGFKNFISVIIPTYKDWERLKLCLNSLKYQELEAVRYEVIVVNNDVDSSVPFEPNMKNLKIISEAKAGSYAARNTGIQSAKGDLLAFIDSDCKADKKWLKNALAYFPKCDLIGGNIELFINEEESDPDQSYTYNLINGFPQEHYVKNRNASVTANLITKKEVFLKTGMFREDLFSGGDIEWCQRANSNGFQIGFAKDVTVYHPARSLSQLAEKNRRQAGGTLSNNDLPEWMFLLKKTAFILLYPIKYITTESQKEKSLKFFFQSYYLRFVAFSEIAKIILFKEKRKR